ncbi:MAG: energy-coupling factor transporter transmembrane component T family protein [Acidimicrobiales bacterium]
MSAASGSLRLLRYIPYDTPVHRLWAGTKLLSVLALGIALFVKPTFVAEAVMACVLAGAVAVGKVPASALPRLPKWLPVVIAVDLGLAMVSGGRPYVHVVGLTLGVGGIALGVRFLAFAALVLWAAMVVGWTTPLSELAPSISRLARPLRALRLPVDEAVAATALAVRCLPLFGEELTALLAARRARRSGPTPLRMLPGEAVDLLAVSMGAALRRAEEMSAAMVARGGAYAGPAAPARLTLADAAAAGIVAAACVLMVMS